MKIFAVSDIHGNASVLEKALHEAGFDSNDPGHLFVGCGDYFDRGNENRKVLEYLGRLKHKVLVRGNHESMLLDALDRGWINFRDVINYTSDTLIEFFGQENIGPGAELPKKTPIERKLRAFVNSTVDYFETERYVFVHGWVPVNPDAPAEGWRKRWRTVSPHDWEKARWLEWPQMYREGLTLTDKTLVCGHRAASSASFFDRSRSREDNSIFYGKKMIAIDGTVFISRRINVLVIEDERVK